MNIEPADTDAWNIAEKANPSRPAIIRYRPNLRAHLGAANYPRRLLIVWEFAPDNESGMPSEAQNGELREFEDTLIAALDPDRVAILAFVFTQGGVREWHFYVRDVGEVGRRINEALALKPKLPISLSVEDDPEWTELRRVLDQCK